jgi:predicted transcriptional regulator
MAKTKNAAQAYTDVELTAICRQLSNQTKWNIISYIAAVRYATATVIICKLSLNQSAVSKALRSLVEIKLLSRTKVGSSVIYEINPDTWNRVADHFVKLAG